MRFASRRRGFEDHRRELRFRKIFLREKFFKEIYGGRIFCEQQEIFFAVGDGGRLEGEGKLGQEKKNYELRITNYELGIPCRNS